MAVDVGLDVFGSEARAYGKGVEVDRTRLAGTPKLTGAENGPLSLDFLFSEVFVWGNDLEHHHGTRASRCGKARRTTEATDDTSNSTASPRHQAQQPCLTRIRPGIAHCHRRGWVAVSRVTQRDTISVDPDFDPTTVWKPAMPISTRLSGFPIRAASGYRPALPSPSRARQRRCFVRKAKGRGILVWRNLAGQCLVTRIDLDLWQLYHGQGYSPNMAAAHAIRPPTTAESWPWKPCPLHLKLTSLVREGGLVTQSWMMTSAIRTSRSASRDLGRKK